MRTIQSFAGANVYSHRPAVVLHLDAEDFNDKISGEISGFSKLLLERLPQLAAHFCVRSETGKFAEQLNKDLQYNHLIEHVAVELMALADIGSMQNRTCSDTNRDSSKVIIETTEQEAVRYLLWFAVDFIEAIGEGKTLNIEEAVDEAKSIAARTGIDANTRLVIEAAERRAIPWIRRDEGDLIQLGYGANLHFVRGAITDNSNLIGTETANNVVATKQKLRKFSIPAYKMQVCAVTELD